MCSGTCPFAPWSQRLQPLCHSNPACRNQTAQRHIKVAENQLRGYQEKPDPLASKPQLEAQQRDAVEKHFAAMKDLAALVRAQWVGVRERGAAELALKEADMQVGGGLAGGDGSRAHAWKRLGAMHSLAQLQQRAWLGCPRGAAAWQSV